MNDGKSDVPCTVRHKKRGQMDKRSVIQAEHEGSLGILIKFKSHVSRKAHGTRAEIGVKSGSHAQVPPAEASTIPKEQEEHDEESSPEGEKSSLDELITNYPTITRSDGRREAHALVFIASDALPRTHHEQLLVLFFLRMLCSPPFLFGFHLVSNFNAKAGTSSGIAVGDQPAARQEEKGELDVRARTLTDGRFVARTM